MDILAKALRARAAIWAALLWEFWDAGIRPRLIPAAEIDALAAALLGRHGDKAEEMAFIEQDRAWRYGEGFEKGKWRRVRKRLTTIKPASRGRKEVCAPCSFIHGGSAARGRRRTCNDASELYVRRRGFFAKG